jgi:hypothetical protein
MTTLSGTWGISVQVVFNWKKKCLLFLEVLSGNIRESAQKNIRFSLYGVWQVLPFIKLKVSDISASCSDPASLRNKFNQQVPCLLCIISHRYQYQYSASLNKAINHRFNTSHRESLLYTKII